MPKATVKTTYQRAGSSPSERVPKPQTITDPRPRKKRKDLYAYVRDNQGLGISDHDLIKQYQEYECDHPTKEQEITATGTTTITRRCNKCRWVRTDPKPGVKKDA